MAEKEEIKKDTIFTITTIRDVKFSTRCVGYFHELKIATDEVENNSCDIYEEGYYPYCVIEEVCPGIYPTIKKEFWFKWDKEQNKYIRTDKPYCCLDAINFSIG